MAVAPSSNAVVDTEHKSRNHGNGYLKDEKSNSDDSESSDSEDDLDVDERREQSVIEDSCVALACDDGCVRIYAVSDNDELIYKKMFPRVSGEISNLPISLCICLINVRSLLMFYLQDVV